jgi:hypothetical protein
MKTSKTKSTQFIARPEGRIAYEVAGEGPLVMLLPGMGDLRAGYRFLAPALEEAGYRVANEVPGRWLKRTADEVASPNAADATVARGAASTAPALVSGPIPQVSARARSRWLSTVKGARSPDDSAPDTYAAGAASSVGREFVGPLAPAADFRLPCGVTDWDFRL